MKKYVRIISAAALALAVAMSCTKGADSYNPNPASSALETFTLSTSTVTLNAKGDEQHLTVTGAYGAGGLTITNAIGKFATVTSEKTGEGEYDVRVGAAENKGPERRLEVYITDGIKLKSFTVVQLAGE